MFSIRKLLINRTSNIFTQMFRYVIVGGISFVVDYGLLFVFTEWFHFHYLISATLSFIAGLIVNYSISVRWVFQNSKLNNKSAEFTVYGIIGVIGLFLNNTLMFVFTDFLHLHYMISKLVSAMIVLVWNFAGRRIILFKN